MLQRACISYTTGPDAFVPGIRASARGSTVALMSPEADMAMSASGSEGSAASVILMSEPPSRVTASACVAGASNGFPEPASMQLPSPPVARPEKEGATPPNVAVASSKRMAMSQERPMSGQAVRTMLQPATPAMFDSVVPPGPVVSVADRSVVLPVTETLAFALSDRSEPMGSSFQVTRSPSRSNAWPDQAVPLNDAVPGLMELATSDAGRVASSVIANAAAPSRPRPISVFLTPCAGGDDVSDAS